MAANIFPIKMGLDTVYIVKDVGMIAIDGGDPHRVNKFKRSMDKLGLRPDEIQLLVHTHGHWDHIGSSQDIKNITGAKTLLHEDDVRFLTSSKTLQPPGFKTWGKIITGMLEILSPLIPPPTFDLDIVLSDGGMSLEDYGISGKVIHTPGHSQGSVSVLLDSGDAFVGDLAMNALPMRLNPGLPIFGDDIELVKHSWRKLLKNGAKTVYPSHGKPFPAEIIRKAVI